MIPSYLDFNQERYEPYIITSRQTYKPTSLINTESTNLSLLDTNNNCFQVIQYYGTFISSMWVRMRNRYRIWFIHIKYQINLLETVYFNRELYTSIFYNNL